MGPGSGDKEAKSIRGIRIYQHTREKTDMTVQNIMSFRLVKLKPTDRVCDALSIMHQQQIRNLPVVDEDDQFIGLFGIRPLIRCGHRYREDQSGDCGRAWCRVDGHRRGPEAATGAGGCRFQHPRFADRDDGAGGDHATLRRIPVCRYLGSQEGRGQALGHPVDVGGGHGGVFGFSR